MNIIESDIWDFANSSVIGIPTNGFLTRNGAGVLGRGLALQAREKYPEVSYNLGQHLKVNGHCVGYILKAPVKLLSIPVKPSHCKILSTEDRQSLLSRVSYLYKDGQTAPGFHCKANLSIIERSLSELVKFIKDHNIPSVHIPLLGCGNGELNPMIDLFPLLVKLNLPDEITLVFPSKKWRL